MEERRTRNLVTASVATAVVFLVILMTVLVFQMIALGRVKKQQVALDELIAEYEERSEYYEQEIELWNERWKIIQEARKLGYKQGGK